jgi:hypothetical protein
LGHFALAQAAERAYCGLKWSEMAENGVIWKPFSSQLRAGFQVAKAGITATEANSISSLVEISVSAQEIREARGCWGIRLGNPARQ